MLDSRQKKLRRQQKVASQLTKVLSQLLQERDLLTQRDGNFVVISRLELADDFSHARVYCAAFGADGLDLINNLQAQNKTIRSWLTAKKLYRYCPLLTFHHDQGQEVALELLARLEKG